MSSSKEQASGEIIVVRRKGGGEDDHHHGGVWKIAYADFMTAMMAFFLVMWLINAANTETKSRVASYFNPIKLMDSIPRRKGLRNVDDKPDAGDKPQGPDSARDDAKKPKEMKSNVGGGAHNGGLSQPEPETRSAQEAGPVIDPKTFPTRAEQPGEAFRDPFNPEAGARLLDQFAKQAERQADPAVDKPAPVAQPGKALEKTAETIRAQVEAALQQFGAGGGPDIDVVIEDDAVVISLTDTNTFGMFAIGSTEANDDLVQLIHRIAPIISRAGSIIVRGHTDSRPYRGDPRNNNWRLAMGRAEAAYRMLLRAGIEEARFERIEAHADRKPKIPNQPEAAANRRIDILMRKSIR